LAQAYQNSSSSRKRTSGMKLPKLNTLHSASVVSMQEFGAFMQLGDGDTYKDGLLHVSNMGSERFESPEAAGLKLGMKVWVKVYEVKEDQMKYSLDMRYVSQRDGKDLDPYNGRGRLPDNHFEGGRVKPAPSQVAASAPLARQAELRPLPESTRKRKAGSGASSDSDNSEKRAKVSKKLEKARKKLEKARKKAEKAKKKLEKKAKKKQKGKKDAKAVGPPKAGEASPSSASSSSAASS